MKCLEEYILQNLVTPTLSSEQVFTDIARQLSRANDYFKAAISKIFVVASSHPRYLPSVKSTEHSSVVDECIRFLRSCDSSSNVLTYGYKVAKNADVLSTIHCESTNLNVSKLKCGIWCSLHKILGTANFVNLLVNSTIFELRDGHFHQIVGRVHEHPTRGALEYQATVGNFSFLYRNRGDCKIAEILPHSPQLLWLQIFEESRQSVELGEHLVAPRGIGLLKILCQVIKNHRKLKYLCVLQAICPRKNKKTCTSNADFKSDVKNVNKFLTVILEKLIPLEFFGSKHNKSVLLSKIKTLLKLHLHGRIFVAHLIEGLRIKDIRWLGSPSRIDGRESTRRQGIVKIIVEWLFGRFLPFILKTFFYCTELSATQEILFFRFDVWSEMTGPFLSLYFKKHLVLNKNCSDHTSDSDFTHGFLRLTPKLNKFDFRVIFVPLKCRSQDQLKMQLDKTHNAIRPTACILNYILTKGESRASDSISRRLCSPLEIVPAVSEFKRALVSKYQQFPQLFFIKFDIQSCYDSIPKVMAKHIISLQAECYADFYVRSYSFYDSRRDVFKQRFSVNGEKDSEFRSVEIDNVRTTYLSKNDVLDILDDELNNCAIIHKGSCYLRKSGIFQGAAFSSNVVDFLYNDLIDNEKVFTNYSNADVVILRLADDFLAISTSRTYIERMEIQVREGFKDYNASANLGKIVSNVKDDRAEVRFCAVDVDLKPPV
ncbi:LAME_0H04676g1_1 [Lachancea meyersii CBS 8951]|uniref:Telomerase reverse transcriptase n=1 Tax=Lachancea meyersii CBS 8951 TaxID=1266667 RepID=A0A1G4KDY3_9SACH|nr:LAME_0H04676g1_1 [Lachancea meyersii CBS 8951]